ncbi:MAG: hypothetical protein ACREAA_00275 [Candidatus Polarisedimenticolia bacterium]
MSRAFMAALAVAALAVSGCGRNQNDQAENPYGENAPAADRYGSAERYGSDPNGDTRTGTMSQPGQFTVPQDALIEVSLNEPLNSQTAKKGDEFTAEVIEPVKVNDVQVIPAGAVIHGVVKDVFDPAIGPPRQQPGPQPPFQTGEMDPTKARLTLAFTRLELPDGFTTNIVANIPDPSELKMARERGLGGGSSAGGEVLGSREDEMEKEAEEAEKMMRELPADIKAGGVGTAIIVSKNGPHITLPAGTEMVVQLDEPLRLDHDKSKMYDQPEKEEPQDWDSDPNK